jgi:predicted enzyme related to lactoylglutathione lyase
MSESPVNLSINIDVPDLRSATRFYVDAFGLRVGRRFDGAVELLGAAVPIFLLAKSEGSLPFSGAAAGRSYVRHWTPVHIDVIVRDLEAAGARAAANGARGAGGVSEHSWGRMALFSDPFGNGFCLLELRGRGYDEMALE